MANKDYKECGTRIEAGKEDSVEANAGEIVNRLRNLKKIIPGNGSAYYEFANSIAERLGDGKISAGDFRRTLLAITRDYKYLPSRITERLESELSYLVEVVCPIDFARCVNRYNPRGKSMINLLS